MMSERRWITPLPHRELLTPTLLVSTDCIRYVTLLLFVTRLRIRSIAVNLRLIGILDAPQVFIKRDH